MKIEVMYLGSCGHYRSSLELVQQVVAELGVDAEIHEVEVGDQETAEKLRFLGSPSVHVDGVDIEPGAEGRTEFGLV